MRAEPHVGFYTTSRDVTQSSQANDIPATSELMSRHQRVPGLSSFSG